VLPARGVVLELASGSGQHVAKFAAALPGLTWQPSDVDAAAIASIASRVRGAAVDNVKPPLCVDVEALPWPVSDIAAVLCINMIHISPWSATLALFAGASSCLRDGGTLVTYGPYKRDGRHTAPSNAAFDASLRARNSAWGLRGIEEVSSAAGRRGFALREVLAMPANNFTLVFDFDSAA
jgi:SAM-dependent methyltransferase